MPNLNNFDYIRPPVENVLVQTLARDRFETFVKKEALLIKVDVDAKKTRDKLMGVFHDGCILDGIEKFGEDGKEEGLNNGLFSCFISLKDAPEAAEPELASRTRKKSPWSLTKERQQFSQDCFVASVKARIPFVMEGDVPDDSPMGEMMDFALNEGLLRLGYIGKKSGRGPLHLNRHFTDAWRRGVVSDKQRGDTLRGGTFTIDNTEVSDLRRGLPFPE